MMLCKILYNHPELAAAALIWRDLSPSPEAVAFESLPFLVAAMHGRKQRGHTMFGACFIVLMTVSPRPNG